MSGLAERVAWDVIVALLLAGFIALIIPFIRRRLVVAAVSINGETAVERLEREWLVQKKQYESQISELQRQVHFLLRELAHARREIEELKKNSEYVREVTPPLAPLVLLICGTDDRFCNADQRALNRANMRYERLQKVNKPKIQDEFHRKREDRRPWKLVHISAHADDSGIRLPDGIAEPQWWADQMEGVTVCVLAACETMTVADAIAGVVHYVLAIREQIDNEDAARLTFSFWRAVKDGMHVLDAFESAISETPQVRSFVTLRTA